MMHQTQRLVSLADDLGQNKEVLQLLFLLICAEHIAKLYGNFTGEGQSRPYVRKFFRWFLSAEQQQQFSQGVRKPDSGVADPGAATHRPTAAPKRILELDLDLQSLQSAVDALYAVRCDVVHEGNTWSFSFPQEGKGSMINEGVIVSLTAAEFRSLVVWGCIKAIERYPDTLEG